MASNPTPLACHSVIKRVHGLNGRFQIGRSDYVKAMEDVNKVHSSLLRAIEGLKAALPHLENDGVHIHEDLSDTLADIRRILDGEASDA